MVVHCGRSMDSGHNYCFQQVRTRWYAFFNDAQVTLVDWEDVVNIAAGRNKSHCPTVLLYTRWDWCSLASLPPQEEKHPGRPENAHLRPEERRRGQPPPVPEDMRTPPVTPPMPARVSRVMPPPPALPICQGAICVGLSTGAHGGAYISGADSTNVTSSGQDAAWPRVGAGCRA